MCQTNQKALLEAIMVLQPRSMGAVLSAVALGHRYFNEIARQTIGSKEMVSKDLRRLVSLHYVAHDEDTGAYTLGACFVASGTQSVPYYDDDPIITREEDRSSSRSEPGTQTVPPKYDPIEVDKLVTRLREMPYRIDNAEMLVKRYWPKRQILIAWAENLATRPPGMRGRNTAGLLCHLTEKGEMPPIEEPKVKPKGTDPEAYFTDKFSHLINRGRERRTATC